MKKDLTKQSKKSTTSQLNALLADAKKIVQEIDKINREATDTIDKIDAKINKSIVKVERIFSDLDRIEKKAGDEIDKLILRQAEDLSKE